MTASHYLCPTILVKEATLSYLSNFNSYFIGLPAPTHTPPLSHPLGLGHENKSKQSNTKPSKAVFISGNLQQKKLACVLAGVPLCPPNFEVMNQDLTRLDIKLQPLGWRTFKVPNQEGTNLYPGMITEGSKYSNRIMAETWPSTLFHQHEHSSIRSQQPLLQG